MPNDPTPNLPAVRPARPPYIEAFEKFTHGKDDQIEAFVAFGLFVSSDYSWAAGQPSWPSDELTRNMYARLLHADEVQKTESRAKQIVDNHRETLVREHEKKYLEYIFKEIDGRIQNIVTKASRRHFWRGVLEAFVGAFFWTVVSAAIVAAFYFGTIETYFEKIFHRGS